MNLTADAFILSRSGDMVKSILEQTMYGYKNLGYKADAQIDQLQWFTSADSGRWTVVLG